VSGIALRGWQLHENPSHWRYVCDLDRVQLPKASTAQARSHDDKNKVRNGCEDVETINFSAR
jgi:hypothetical protein